MYKVPFFSQAKIDLNLNNLSYLVDIGNINEVSIGHAIIVDSLHYGFEETIKKYLDIIRN